MNQAKPGHRCKLARIVAMLCLVAACRTPPFAANDDGAANPASPTDAAQRFDALLIHDEGSGDCTRALVGVNLQKSDPSCILVESVTTSTARLTFPCDGGTASATFDTDTFTGTVELGVVSLTMSKPFGWSDGCQWETHQTITGQLSTGLLHFTYEENPLAGQSGCVFSCSGTADVLVQ